jgi:hypothetical protein
MPESGDFPATKNQERSRVKLRVCDPSECEARCCYDGVYLEDGEEAKINEIVASALGFFRKLPADFIMNGSWGDGRITGRKTAVRPYDFKAADFPAHFSRTRCVFCSEDHKCLLQVLAVQRGLHKWTYKPKACWMFPMELDDGKPAPPPSVSESDPQCLDEEYPGFVKFVPCGRDRPDGDPWEQTLADEIEYWHETKSNDSGIRLLFFKT